MGEKEQGKKCIGGVAIKSTERECALRVVMGTKRPRKARTQVAQRRRGRAAARSGGEAGRCARSKRAAISSGGMKGNGEGRGRRGCRSRGAAAAGPQPAAPVFFQLPQPPYEEGEREPAAGWRVGRVVKAGGE